MSAVQDARDREDEALRQGIVAAKSAQLPGVGRGREARPHAGVGDDGAGDLEAVTKEIVERRL
jgi:hypothetical protein